MNHIAFYFPSVLNFKMIFLAAVIAAVPWCKPLHAVAEPQQEQLTATVEHLIGYAKNSGLTFIRNGKESDAATAAEHVQRKYEYFKDEIRTAEEFIEKSATKSLRTGKPYLVRLEDGSTVEVANWLREELARYREQQKQQS